MLFSERFCEADWRKFRNKEAAASLLGLQTVLMAASRLLCTLIFSVALTHKFIDYYQGGGVSTYSFSKEFVRRAPPLPFTKATLILDTVTVLKC